MFVTRNLLDRILPFFALVAMNYIIIKALKKEYARQGPKQRINEKPEKAKRSSLRVSEVSNHNQMCFSFRMQPGHLLQL